MFGVPGAAESVPASYRDAFGKVRDISPSARAAVARAMGVEPDPVPPVVVARRGAALDRRGELTLEDGTALGMLDAVPRDAPFGYHVLRLPDGAQQTLITGPGRCHLPDGLRDWGWAIQLAATRSGASWGIGDLGDLRDLAIWSADVGAGFVAVGPLNAPNPGPNPDPSPYFPSTRRFGNPIHLRVDDVPGASAAGPEDLARAGRALNDGALVDRPAALELKLRALGRIWEAGTDRATFESWRREQGEPLEHWSTFVVLCERLGTDWRSWPEAYRRPTPAVLAEAARDQAERVAFHAWVQWCFDLQLRTASGPVRRIADMPVGVDPGGFDAWDWQDDFAPGLTIGVPPDRFNLAGQDWGMPAFSLAALRRAAYRPFIETLRAQLRHAGGLRIDHVLGLFRLWCIPDGSDATEGAYVHLPTDELLEVVALESVRAGAVVIGEDLGTVPAGVRPELRRRRILSTRLALFERVPPASYPVRAMAGVTTHDLPTIAGLVSGTDLADQRAAGITPDPKGGATLLARLRSAAGVGEAAGALALSVALHRALAASPSMLVAATLEDAIGVERRPNLPGTLASQRPNWSIPLRVRVDELASDPNVGVLVDAMVRGGRDVIDEVYGSMPMDEPVDDYLERVRGR